MSEKVFEAKNIKVKRKSTHDFTLGELNFYVNKGEVLGILGKNGAGKTTLIDCVTGMLKPETGYTLYSFQTPGRNYKDDMAYVSYNWDFNTHGTVLKFAKHYGSFYSEYNHEKFRSLCDKLKVPIHVKISKLSQGQQILFNLAFGLARYPKLLVMDEPFSNLDPISREHVMKIIRDEMDRENLTVIYSTQMIDELQSMADRILYLDYGVQRLFKDVNELQDIYFPNRRVNLEELFEISELNQGHEYVEEDLIGDEWKID